LFADHITLQSVPPSCRSYRPIVAAAPASLQHYPDASSTVCSFNNRFGAVSGTYREMLEDRPFKTQCSLLISGLTPYGASPSAAMSILVIANDYKSRTAFHKRSSPEES